MKNLLRICILLGLLAMNGNYAISQEKTPNPKVLSKLFESNSPVGRDFWVAIPPNDPNNGGYWEIEFYIASKFNTTAYVENVNTGDKKTFNIKANGVAIAPFFSGDEVKESEEITNKGWHIYSKDPISVYMLNTRPTTSDGYMALPTNVLGKEYIHVAHYEFNDFGTQPVFGTGFLITATEDQTKVRFTLKGKGAPRTLKNGWPLGTTKDIVLQKGQTYMLRTKGNTSNQNDITGSSIVATKPISLVSFHMRANFPSGVVTGSRDCLSEMLPPVQAWGKRFVTIPFATKSDKGDLFRVVASQNGTEVIAKVYDKSGKLTKKKQAFIDKGGFIEWDNPSNINSPQSINGPTYWEASKPVLIMQYAMSQAYYADGNYDPDMVIIPPIDQYIQGTVFQTPPGERFATNWFYLYALGDSTDANFTKLKSIMLDGRPVWKNYTTLVTNRIPGTNVYWVYISVQPGPHYIDSDTKFGGIINGFSSVDGYTWPAAMAVNKIDVLDTLPPVLVKENDCGDWNIEATEYRTYGKETDSIRQVDQGVNAIEVIEALNYEERYEITLPATGELPSDPKAKQVKFTFKLIDKKQDGRLIYVVRDAAGNLVLDTLTYTADLVEFNPDPLDFGEVRVNKTAEKKVDLTNPKDKTILIKEIKMLDGTLYTLKDGITELLPKETKQVTVVYSPKKVSKDKKPDIDSLIVESTCGRFTLAVKGIPVGSILYVSDYNYGTNVQGGPKVKSNMPGDERLYIENRGNADLTITGATSVDIPFINGLSLPLTVPAGTRVVWNFGEFDPKLGAGTYTTRIQLTGIEIDEVAKDYSDWHGLITSSSVTISDVSWQRRRAGTKNTGTVTISNKGTNEVNISRLLFADPTVGNIFTFDQISNVTLAPAQTTTVNVTFNPEAVKPADGYKNNIVVAYTKTGIAGQTFYTTEDDKNSSSKAIGGELVGGGYIPDLSAEDVTFVTPTELGKVSTEIQKMVIKNTSDTTLHIYRVEWADPTQTIFSWINPKDLNQPTVATFDEDIPAGQSISFDISFKPRFQGGGNNTDVLIYSDKGISQTGREEDRPSRMDTVIVKGIGLSGEVNVKDVPWPATLTCDQRDGEITVTNSGATAVTFDSYSWMGVDQSAFELVDKDFPMTIQPGETKIKVRFKPTEAKNYTASIIFKQGEKAEHASLLTGTGIKRNITLTLGKIQAGPGDKTGLDVMIDNPNADEAKVTSLKAVITFKRQLHLTSESPINVNGWTFTSKQTLLAGATEIEITGSGSTPLPKTGTIVSVPVTVLLFDPEEGTLKDGEGIFSFEPQLPTERISFGDRNACVIPEGKPGLVEVGSCFIVGRPIKIEGDFNLVAISPNPAIGSNLNVEYQVAFAAHTRVDIVNSMGEVVRVINDANLNSGKYSAIVDASTLASGQYTIRMYSGPYVEAHQFIITK